MNKTIRSKTLRYGLALVMVALATLVTRRFQGMLGEISPLFFVAVMTSAWFGGIGPGLLATALAAWASAYFFLDIPAGSGAFGLDDLLRLSIFLMIALLISFLLNMRRRAEVQLRIANERLEARVIERTKELQDSNRKLRESEAGLKALIEGVTDCAICLLDQAGRVDRWNSGATRIQGYDEAEILGEPFSVFFPQSAQASERPADSLSIAARTGRDETEGWRIRKDGSPFWANVIITPLKDETGMVRGFAHVARDITELKRLEKEVIDISENEQRRIGNDLHDGLGQELTGAAFLCQNICRRLSDASRPEAAELSRVAGLINGAIEQTRDLARGLSPVEWGPDGLSAALGNLAVRIRELYAIACEFYRSGSTEIHSHTAAVHLFRIAQEALSNAARHSAAKRITISMQGADGQVTLTIEDDGIGMNLSAGNASVKGLGLHLMPYRARTIGATFELLQPTGGGTIIRCVYREAIESPQTNTTA